MHRPSNARLRPAGRPAQAQPRGQPRGDGRADHEAPGDGAEANPDPRRRQPEGRLRHEGRASQEDVERADRHRRAHRVGPELPRPQQRAVGRHLLTRGAPDLYPRLAPVDPAQAQARRPHRGIEREDRAPADQRVQHAPHGRADHRRDGHGGGDHAHLARRLARRIHVAQRREPHDAARHHQRLHQPAGEEDREIDRQRRAQRGQRIDRQCAEDHGTPPQVVRDRPEDQLQHSRRHHVGRHRQPHRALVHAEGHRHVGQRGQEHVERQNDQRHQHDHGAEMRRRAGGGDHGRRMS
jgi:hypothetical protein